LTVFYQIIIGVFSTYLFYEFCIIKTNKKEIAFIATFISTSFLHVIFYEFAILTESLTFALMILAFWYIERYKLMEASISLKHVFILSIILSVLYLTKPLFIYFPLGYFLFFITKHFKVSSTKVSLILVVPFISFYSWNSLNEKNIGYFTSSYYLGINLAQTATSFFEKAPENDKIIRDIFIKHRDVVEQNEPYHQYPMTVWYAYDDLINETELSPQDLSIEFWGGTSTLLWNVDKFKYKLIRKALVGTWNYIQKPLLVIINILFLIFSFKRVFSALKQKLKNLDSNLFMVLIILSGSIAQALVAYGTNSRFCFPFFALIVYFVTVNIFTFKKIKS